LNIWRNDITDNNKLEIGNIYLIEKACDMAILRLKARALGDKVVVGKKMYYWSYYDRKAYISNLPQANLDGIWFNTAEKCEEVMKKYKTDKPDLRKNKKDSNELAFAWILNFPLFVNQANENEKFIRNQ